MITYKEFITENLKVLKEAGYANSDLHPFHKTAQMNGYQHTGTHRNMGAEVHSYKHANGSTLELKKNSSGYASYHHTSKSGTKRSGDNIGHFTGTLMSHNY